MAKRVIRGELFEEDWTELDEEIARMEREEHIDVRKALLPTMSL